MTALRNAVTAVTTRRSPSPVAGAIMALVAGLGARAESDVAR